MQGISGLNANSISSGISSTTTKTALSDAVASCFISSFSSTCNTVSHRSSNRHNLSKYSSPSSSTVGKHTNRELLKMEARKKLSESSENSSLKPAESGFVHAFFHACNTVANRSTGHDAPWDNGRRSDSFNTSSKNAYDTRDSASSYRGMPNENSEKYRGYPFGKPN